MNVAKAVVLKLIVAFMFALMNALVRDLGGAVPVGEVVFFRSAIVLALMVPWFASRGELAVLVRTRSPFGQLARGLLTVCGMFCNFASLAYLPLVDATAISFAAPLVTVALAALVLKERVDALRWAAVAAGLAGVLWMLAPHAEAARVATGPLQMASIGAALALAAAFFQAGIVVQTRRLTRTESTDSIVFYFSLVCAIAGLCTLPFGWVVPDVRALGALVALGALGGASHLLLTHSYRLAPASVLAPFDYTTLVWALVFGFVMFGELPTSAALGGGAVVIVAGLIVIRQAQGQARAQRGP